MPIYEYTCHNCGNKFEALRSIKESDSLIACQYCDSQNTSRSISVCYAHGAGNFSNSSATTSALTSSSGCSGCGGGSCSGCRH
jgi:putative FmdB family regulatory protein